MLIDSNIIVYAALPDNEPLRQWIREHSLAVSIIAYIEVLGLIVINITISMIA